MREFLSHVSELEIADPNFHTAITRLEKAVNDEDNALQKGRKSEYTEILTELDAERDNRFRQIFYLFQSILYTVDYPETEHKAKILLLLEKYTLKICNLSKQEKTKLYRQFLKSVVRFDAPSPFMLMTLATAIAAMKRTNNRFERIYKLRKAENCKATSCTALRAVSDHEYYLLSCILQLNALMNPAGPVTEKCREIIKKWNKYLKK